MKLVLWGYGENGKRVYSQYSDSVIAMIDSSEDKQGYFVDNIPIISFDSYLKKYKDVLIIITIINKAVVYDIEEKLKKSGINHYISYDDGFPNEIVGYNEIYFREKYFQLYSTIFNEHEYVIYGISAYSLFLYNYLKRKNIIVRIISSDKRFFKCNIDGIDMHSLCDIPNDITILLCEENYNNILKKYINHKIIDMYHLGERYYFYKNDVKKFHNKYTGKRCFVVATGPSLTIDVLDMLHKNNEYSFGVNTTYKVFSKTKWRPNFYVVTDQVCQEVYGKEILDQNIDEYFFADCNVKFMNKYKQNNLHYLHVVYERSQGLIRFSDDISKQVYNNSGGGTVIYSCLQIACYLGFNEIYIIGADCDYEGVKKHFINDYYHDSDEGEKRIFNNEGAFIEYQSARQYADYHDLKIYNATQGGKLEIFNRVNVNDLFKNR